MSTQRVFFDISLGDAEAYATATAAYDQTARFLAEKGATYGLPASAQPGQLDSVAQELIVSVWHDEKQYSAQNALPSFKRPSSLVLGRVVVELNGLATKAQENFFCLCTGSKGFSKQVKTAKLHYLDVPFHRIVKDFVCQGGDVTRKDGSGGDSIYGGKFNDDKSGLIKGFKKGTVAMANSGKNSNTSQFFFCLSDDTSKYAKIEGKHVVLGQVMDMNGLRVLDQINELAASTHGESAIRVWISNCGTSC